MEACAAILLFTGCQSAPGIPHLGERKICYTKVICDSIKIDGSQTSLLGQWIMAEDTLYFFDACIVGVKAFTLDGQFVSEHIHHGRGPNEMVSPAEIAAYDPVTKRFLIQDTGTGNIYCFDSSFKQVWKTSKPFYLTDTCSATEPGKWQDLLLHPDPERYEIYEYNIDCHRINCTGGHLILPIVSDHIKFNKYYLSANSKKYFRTAHLFLSARADSVLTRPKLIGHYPSLYKSGTLSMFSEYDFYTDNHEIVISFAADSLIYRMDADGAFLATFGYACDGISGKYPAIKSFEEYETSYKKQRSHLGFYQKLSRHNGLIFRTCQQDNGKSWRLQIYDEKTWDQIGDIPIGSSWEILGFKEGYYYALVGESLNTEEFYLLRFKLSN